MQRFNLSEQMRAVDGEHSTVVASTRRVGGLGVQGGIIPITRHTTSYLKALTKNDHLADESWLDAPIVCTSNRERLVVTEAQTGRQVG